MFEVGLDVTVYAPMNVEEHTVNRMKEFDVKGRKKGGILFLGDSNTEHFELDNYFNNRLVYNQGISGDTTEGVLNRLDQVIQLQPKKIFLQIGTNDICNGLSKDEIVTNIKKIVVELNGYDIYLISIYPINESDDELINKIYSECRSNNTIKAINNELKNIQNVTYIDMYTQLIDEEGNLKLEYTTEGLHINKTGYDVISKLLKDYM